jgi:putative transposase
VTVSETAGRWFVSVLCEQETSISIATGEPVGVDLGIKTMAVCSDGQHFENPKALRKTQKKLRRVQRELSRRKKGGSNRDKTRQKLAKVHYRIANIRKDALHKATSAITARTKPDSKRPSVVVVEDLNVAGMVKNHRLAQAIVDVGFGEFRRQAEYKTTWAGEQLMVAPRFFASSRLCSVCGLINSELTLADRFWTCVCGAFHDRDKNAANNLKNLAIGRSPKSHACGENVRPESQALLVEAGTKHEAS